MPRDGERLREDVQQRDVEKRDAEKRRKGAVRPRKCKDRDAETRRDKQKDAETRGELLSA